MRLPVAALLLACEAAAFSWTGNFGERIVSGSSAQIDQDADRYGNVNQLHGKHVFSYTTEREAYEATLKKNIQEPPPPPHQPPAQQQQQQQQQAAAVPTEEQTPPEPRSSVATTEQIPTTTAPTTSTPEETGSVGAKAPPDTRNRRPAIATSVGTAASGAVSPDAIRNRGELHGGYGGYTIGAKTPPDTRNRRPATASSAGTAAASGSVSPDATRNRGELHGGYGGYSRPLGTFSTVSGSSAQYLDDRYGNFNQLHGKHCHEYTQEREAFEAAAIQKEQNVVLPRSNDVVGKDPDVNQEAC